MKVAREEIVTAARELFREKGYAGASMQDLAERVGLKKASLYMRFANKEALVPEVMDLLLRDTLSEAGAGGAGGARYPAYAALVRAIADTLSDRKRCVGLHLAYGVGDETPVAKQAVRTFFQSLRDRMSDILARAMPSITAEILAADALVRLEGATLLIAVFDEVTPMERAVEAVLSEARAAARRKGSR
ncbi:helix-turn-helix domain-containing protein (plasmid) [Rhizobium johnstonii]|nr:helix-turn-helix domain-containing protein [Rhizobium johnstonii]